MGLALLDRRRPSAYAGKAVKNNPPMKPAVLSLLALLLTGPALAQSAEEVAFAREFLDRLQVRSIVEDREYCGYFGRSEDGRFLATRPRRGKYNSCSMGSPPESMNVFASYHTHAAYERYSVNEIPSLQDLRSDIDQQIDGYVSTPGGRLWLVDHKARETRQICGEGCVAQDPVYRPGKFEKVRPSYTLDDLEWMME